MKLYLEAREGPLKGKKVHISRSIYVGRGEAELLINDPKLSGIHAFFEKQSNGAWLIIDKESRNGVWVNGHKESQRTLKDGDSIQLGDSVFICRFLETSPHKYSKKFQKKIQDFVREAQDGAFELKEVRPEMHLKVIQGVQYGEEWQIFYGPRQAGYQGLDICLYDEKAPEEAFEIQVKGGYAYFHTNHEDIVMLNDKNVKSKQFKPGDIISIGESLIQVEFED